jgi:hypothetical protein
MALFFCRCQAYSPHVIARSEILRLRSEQAPQSCGVCRGADRQVDSVRRKMRFFASAQNDKGRRRRCSARLQPRAVAGRHDLKRSYYIRVYSRHSGDCRASASLCSGLWLTAITLLFCRCEAYSPHVIARSEILRLRSEQAPQSRRANAIAIHRSQ